MRVITTTALLRKYNVTEQQVKDLLGQLSSTVDILDMSSPTAIKAYTDPIQDSILFVGGHDVVPHFIISNPCNDPDAQIYTDAPYGCVADPLYYTPDKVVSRLPDEQQNPSWDYVTTVVNNQKQHMANQPGTVGWFNYTASVWKGISDFMFSTFSMNNQNISPPVVDATLDENQIIGKRYHYVNLHGAQQTPYYYGQTGDTYPIALSPKPNHFENGFLFTEACYGAWTINRNRQTSIPLMALYSNAVGVIGSTAIAYGPATAPADGADMLSMCFYQHLLKGETIGQAFINAKKDFTTNIIQRDGNLEPSNKKTILEFVLFGTCDIKLT